MLPKCASYWLTTSCSMFYLARKRSKSAIMQEQLSASDNIQTTIRQKSLLGNLRRKSCRMRSWRCASVSVHVHVALEMAPRRLFGRSCGMDPPSRHACQRACMREREAILIRSIPAGEIGRVAYGVIFPECHLHLPFASARPRHIKPFDRRAPQRKALHCLPAICRSHSRAYIGRPGAFFCECQYHEHRSLYGDVTGAIQGYLALNCEIDQ